MPYGDRTGPLGQGPMTGRGAGFCAGYGAPGFASPGFGLGFGRGRGWRRGGFGFRHNYYATGLFGWQRAGWGAPWPGAAAPTREDELAALKDQADALKSSLDAIEKRMKEIDENMDK
ncbi:hypothetical protein EH222_03275 [candidate division KSB1 bacterium]|nr:MAG: hypothetical protein EH222_03275 [candidate division KSB1 bacterium]